MKVYCPECEHACSDSTQVCPRCRHRLTRRNPLRRRRLILLGGGVALVVAVVALYRHSDVSSDGAHASSTAIAYPQTQNALSPTALPRGFAWDQLNNESRQWCEDFSDREITYWIIDVAKWRDMGVPQNVASARAAWGTTAVPDLEIRRTDRSWSCVDALIDQVWSGAIPVDQLVQQVIDPTRPRARYIDEIRMEVCWLNTNTFLFNMMAGISKLGDGGVSRTDSLSWASRQLKLAFGDSFADAREYGDDYIARCAEVLVREVYAGNETLSED